MLKKILLCCMLTLLATLGYPQTTSTLYKGIEWNNPDMKISEYFSVDEVFTNGAEVDWNRQKSLWELDVEERTLILDNVLRLSKKLDEIREKYGPIIILSWYRDPDTNLRIGGVENSSHLLGLAADIRPIQYDGKELEKQLDSSWEGGLGFGWDKKGFIHIDLNSKRRWDY